MEKAGKRHTENKKEKNRASKKSPLSAFALILKISLAIALFLIFSFVAYADDVVVQSGKVGIGTANPSNAKLQFDNSIGDKINFYYDGTYAHGIDLQPSGLLRMFAGGSQDSIAWGYKTNGVFNEWMRIKAGNVGIGTTNPGTYKLNVAGTGSNNVMIKSTDSYPYITLEDGAGLINSVSQAGGEIYLGGGNTGTYAINFRNGWDVNMKLTSDGEVGIGTANPGAKLTVKAAGGATGGIRLQNSNDYGPVVNIYESGGDGAIDLYTGNNPTQLRTHISSYGDTYFNPNAGGVAIGTTVPAAGYKLDVEGKIQANVFDTGDITFTDQKTQQTLWRMFEDEEGLYLENSRNGKLYKFVLEEIKT